MILSNGTVSTSFEAIKQELDLAYSYIFEKSAWVKGENEFKEVLEALPRLKVHIHGRKVYRDGDRERVLLVVKIDFDRTDRIMQELMSIGLPEDITFYAYGSHPVS